MGLDSDSNPDSDAGSGSELDAGNYSDGQDGGDAAGQQGLEMPGPGLEDGGVDAQDQSNPDADILYLLSGLEGLEQGPSQSAKNGDDIVNGPESQDLAAPCMTFSRESY